jgi:23S rRNA (adenine2503-C2)-methyltransferase
MSQVPRRWIYDLSLRELSDDLIHQGFNQYASKQIFNWLYKHRVSDVSLWTNISKDDRSVLQDRFDTRLPGVVEAVTDRLGTWKYSVGLSDGQRIEAVLIPEKHHYTFCLSTQVGCPLNCRFCATGKMGFIRNLSSGEILMQALILQNGISDFEGKRNIVFMGMGEPLLNYSNLKMALEIITSEQGMSVSPRNITLSTAGLLDGLRQFEKDFPKVKISISLNASDEETRRTLMPVTKKEPLSGLLEYLKSTRRKFRVTFEYVLLAGVNDRAANARDLVKLLRGIPCKINLIPYNDTGFDVFSSPSEEGITRFAEILNHGGYTVMVRRSKGRDIRSACGQLVSNRLPDRTEDSADDQ